MATCIRRWISTRSGGKAMPNDRCSTTISRMASSSLCDAVEGTGLARVTVGRGAAFGDIFNDGKIDVVVNNMDGVPVLLRNVNADKHHWVEAKLVGGPKSPRDAVGATVYLTANGMRQRGDVLSGGSYLSSNDLTSSLRPGRCDGRRQHGDSLAFRRQRDRKAACCRPHLYRYRGQRNYWRAVRRERMRSG